MNREQRGNADQILYQQGVGPRTSLTRKGVVGLGVEAGVSLTQALAGIAKSLSPIVPVGRVEKAVVERRNPFRGMETTWHPRTQRAGQWCPKIPLFEKAWVDDVGTVQILEYQPEVFPQILGSEVPVRRIEVSYRNDPDHLIEKARDMRGDDGLQRGLIALEINTAISEAFETESIQQLALRGVYSEEVVRQAVMANVVTDLRTRAAAQLVNFRFDSVPPGPIQAASKAQLEAMVGKFEGQKELARILTVAQGMSQISPEDLARMNRAAQATSMLRATPNVSLFNFAGLEGVLPGMRQALGGGGPTGRGSEGFAESPSPFGPSSAGQSQPDMGIGNNSQFTEPEPVQVDISPLFNAAVDFAKQRVQQMGWDERELEARLRDQEGKRSFMGLVMRDLQRAVNQQGYGSVLREKVGEQSIRDLVEQELDGILSSSI